MANEAFVLCFDVGTTGNKTCLYKIGETLEFVDSCLKEYPLYITDDGGAEQKVDDWWDAICDTTQTILKRSRVAPEDIKGATFCCQMQGSIMVDKNGNALRNPMIYLDGRSTRQIEKYLHHGLIRISNINAIKLLRTILITGGIAATPKDPLWKYQWVRENEPEIYQNTYKWLDVKDYLISRCTHKFGMTKDSAHITFIYDTRPGKFGWHQGLCELYDVNMDHLPDVVNATDVVGGLTKEAADEMGLSPGTPIFGGGGDVTLTTVGSGCTDLYDTHIYVGTSGWVVSNVDKRMLDISNFIASILGAIPGHYNYVAEQETSGACLQWVRDHLALDDIGVYLKEHQACGEEDELNQLYHLLNQAVSESPPGAGNLIFTPWLHGNRSPREDAYARGMFFNLGMKTGKRDMVRAVLEGVAYHKRWMLEAAENKIPYRDRIRFVGGGAKSEVWCQIMADVTGRHIETIDRPQDVGTAGAAVICGIGLGMIPSFHKAKELIPQKDTYHPQTEYKARYDQIYTVFKTLYKKNKNMFARLNKVAS